MYVTPPLEGTLEVQKPPIHLKRVMVFIDGGYLRSVVKEKIGEDFVNDPQKFAKVINKLISNFITTSHAIIGHFAFEIVRVYYYDAKPLPDDPKFKERDEYFNQLKKHIHHYYPFEMKFGRLIRAGKNGKEPRQKGVDVLLSIDMVVKAFMNHYDIAVLVAGDDDFLDAVKVVKDLTGKKVAGYYNPPEKAKPGTSLRLIESFDYRFQLDWVYSKFKK